MKVIKRNSKKYPVKVKLSNGKTLIVPKQSEFDNEFLRKHGCSLMAEYIGLQWGGIKKYPINLLKWHKKNTPKEVFSKVTLRGVDEGLDILGKGKISSKYYRVVTEVRMKHALENGRLVIMEQKDPIHTIVIVPDKDGYFVLSHGKVTKTTASKIVKTATTNDRYRGMIVVKEVKK